MFLTVQTKHLLNRAADLERIILKNTRGFLEEKKPIELLNSDLNSLDLSLWKNNQADVYNLVLFACRVPAAVSNVIVFN